MANACAADPAPFGSVIDLTLREPRRLPVRAEISRSVPTHVAPIRLFPSIGKIPVKALVVQKQSLFNKLVRLSLISDISNCLILDNLIDCHFSCPAVVTNMGNTAIKFDI